MCQAADPRDEHFLRGFFVPGESRQVLGVTLVNDPRRGDVVFPAHTASLRPRVFVDDPGDRAEALGLTDLAAGDALWLFGDDTARFRLLGIDSIATFVVGACARHCPSSPSPICFVFGDGMGRDERTGRTACRSIQMSMAEAQDLGELAEALITHAARKRFSLGRSRRHYEGAPYWFHVLRRWILTRRTRIREGNGYRVPDASLPVHRQYLHILLRELSTSGPLSMEIAAEGDHLAFRSPEHPKESGALDQEMRHRQLGSAKWFFGDLRRMSDGNTCTIRYALSEDRHMAAVFEFLGPHAARCTTTFA